MSQYQRIANQSPTKKDTESSSTANKEFLDQSILKNNEATNNDGINSNTISKEKTLLDSQLSTEICERDTYKVAKSKEQKHSIAILGDSVAKYVNGYEP